MNFQFGQLRSHGCIKRLDIIARGYGEEALTIHGGKGVNETMAYIGFWMEMDRSPL